jgi:MFS family permease
MKPDRGLDGLNVLLSAAGAAYGAFIPVYLTSQSWTQTQIGLALTIGTVVSIVSLLPGGMLIDLRARHRRLILAIAIGLAAVAPLLLAAWPRPLPVVVAMSIQAIAGSLLAPAIASVSLGVAGRAALGERLGRNARFGSIGAGLGAAVLGACSIWGGGTGVFLIAAAFTALALLALRHIGPDRDEPDDPAETEDTPPAIGWRAFPRLLRDRRVLIFAVCLALFQIGSIAVVQLAAVEATRRLGTRAGLVIAALVIVPQVVAACIAPMIGRLAERLGRRPVLIAGCSTLPVRDALFAVFRNPMVQVPVQTLEGAGGAVFGVMLPLIAADVTRHGGLFTSCMALLNLASSLGTAISTAIAGWAADRFGQPVAFWMLAGFGMLSVLLLAVLMPETGRRHRQAAPLHAGARSPIQGA